MVSRLSYWLLAALILTLGSTLSAVAEETNSSRKRTWKTVADLSPQERQKLDLATDTPRHPQVPYLPAEPYPFTPPYTAEEMGYRLMEFTFYPRWSAVFARAFSSISTQGVLLNPGSTTNFFGLSLKCHRCGGRARPQAWRRNLPVSQSAYCSPPPPKVRNDSRSVIAPGKNLSKKKNGSGTRRPSVGFVMTCPAGGRARYPIWRSRLTIRMDATPGSFLGRCWVWTLCTKLCAFPIRGLASCYGMGRLASFKSGGRLSLSSWEDSYRYYTDEGGVRCYVVEARARPEWLPNYYVPAALVLAGGTFFFPSADRKIRSRRESRLHRGQTR